MIVSGAKMPGKTEWVRTLLAHKENILGARPKEKSMLGTHFRGWYLPAAHAICFIFAGRVPAGDRW